MAGRDDTLSETEAAAIVDEVVSTMFAGLLSTSG
jgi:hypothetical protein